MAQAPGTPPPPSGAPGARPGIVTAAGVLLIIGGAFGILGGILLLGLANIAGIFTLIAIILMVVGALELYAGIQVLALREIGRKLGIGLAAVSAVLALISIGKAPGTNVVNLLLDAFIIYALVSNASYFHA